MMNNVGTWQRLLKEASNMQEVAKKRNILLKESEEKECEFEYKKTSFEKVLKAVEEFDKKSSSEIIHNAVAVFKFVLDSQLRKIKEDYATYLKKYKKAGELTFQIEEFEDYLVGYLDVYRNLKLSPNEISQHNVYPIVIILLIANYHDPSISEDCFFESKKSFYEILKQSNDPVLKGLLENDKAVTENTNKNIFLELL